MALEDGNVSDVKKSKQERIRDNQRRSRARRQEHLSDLERRLADSHALCRDAELQQEALKVLQVENARLRELLALAGVNGSFVDNYVNHGTAQGDPAFRQLRPKISLTSTPIPSHSNGGLQPVNGQQSYQRSSSCHSFTLEQSIDTEASTSSARINMLRIDGPPQSQTSLPPELVNPDQETKQKKPSSENNFCCDSFHVPNIGPLRETPEDTILCSVAKDLIEQYCVNAGEMEVIKSRLATGFCKPAMPNQGCRVNNQILFEVLNDISSKWS